MFSYLYKLAYSEWRVLVVPAKELEKLYRYGITIPFFYICTIKSLIFSILPNGSENMMDGVTMIV